jgi:hypothetical protein
MYQRSLLNVLIARIKEPRQFIQVLLGPRQVGKTTLALQASNEIGKPFHYASADVATLQSISWLEQQWMLARQKVDPVRGCVLIVDEIQKIPDWSQMVKYLWDQDTREQTNLSVVVLGSSPWLVQKGLSESLSGRFEVIPIPHWSFTEMRDSFGWSLDEYIFFGGYPGAASLADRDNPLRWKNYVNESLIETCISRDVLLMVQVNKPALLRRLFQLGCHYSGQVLSYSKMLGELQDTGNTTTLAHYLDLLSGAGLICGLQKFSKGSVRQKASSPKLTVFNTALMSAQATLTYHETRNDPAIWGRWVESCVGAYILNQIRGTSIQAFYWREGDLEVDYVLQKGSSVVAIEVKSQIASKYSGIDEFARRFSPARKLLVGPQGIPIADFISAPITQWI